MPVLTEFKPKPAVAYRITERIVHARGSGAHGIIKLYESLDKYTKAAFLNDTTSETPVFVHAVKPEPHHEIPQDAPAHDTFWDFISLMPESMHMIRHFSYSLRVWF